MPFVSDVAHGIGDVASFFGFKKGGTVPKTGKYLLHKDEVVIPATAVRAIKKFGARAPQPVRTSKTKPAKRGARKKKR